MIVGASVRAAAQAARRAGLEPIAFDLFADRDLKRTARAYLVHRDSYPAAVEALADRFVAEDIPWMYTGALENRADWIDRFADRRVLWGNRGASLRRCRDPLVWTDLFRKAGLECAEVRSSPENLPRDGSWLTKPFASAGGRRIVPLADEFRADSAVFFQKKVEGDAMSALFLADDRGAELIGVTRQLLGLPKAPYAYRGSLGPWPIEPVEERTLRAIGRLSAEALGLRGLVGLDYVRKTDGTVVPIEINPRYPASAEVLELALFRPLLNDHRLVFEPDRRREPLRAIGRPRCVGKSIVFADRDGRFPEGIGDGPNPDTLDRFDVPPIADIPEAGSSHARGEPVLTVLVEAERLDDCGLRLDEAVRLWRERLGPGRSPSPRTPDRLDHGY